MQEPNVSQEATQSIRRALEAASPGVTLPEGADEIIRRSINEHYGLDDAEIVRRADKALAARHTHRPPVQSPN